MTIIDVLYSLEVSSNRVNGALAAAWNRAIRLAVDAVAKATYSRKRMDCGVNPSADNDIVLSLTSMPERLPLLRLCLESLFRQTVKPSVAVLWVERESIAWWEENLRDFVARGLTIRVTEDLKPHKKYYEAFKAFRDSRIVVVDDDVYYPSYLIEALSNAADFHPDCVICGRCHRMKIDDDGIIGNYGSWIGNYDCQTPRFDVLPTGVGGVLYRPSLFETDLLDPELIKDTCLYADDLWLKTIEIRSKVPCVRPRMRNIEYASVRCKSRARQLAESNVDGGRNDAYIKLLDGEYGLGLLIKALCDGELEEKR